MDFNDITIESKSIIEKYTKPWEAPCSDLSFANMFIWGADSKMQFCQHKNALYIKMDFPKVPMFLWPPIPLKNCCFDYGELISDGIEFMRQSGTIPSFRSVTEPFKKFFDSCSPNLFCSPIEKSWDYMYLSESLASLKGKKLHGKRNHINKFLNLYPNYDYKRLTPDMYEQCMRLYNDWTETKQEESIELFDEKKSVQLAIKNMEALGLIGGAIFVDGVLEAFTLGERLTPDIHLIHIEKANADVAGVYPMINQQYVIRECSDVTYINREEDMGIDGMRQAKRSYQPIKMVEKYMYTLVPVEELKGLWGEEE